MFKHNLIITLLRLSWYTTVQNFGSTPVSIQKINRHCVVTENINIFIWKKRKEITIELRSAICTLRGKIP